MEPDDEKPFQDSQNNTPVQRFLARHVPTQLANPRKLCYRHRPDLARLRGPDEYNFTDVQKQMDKLRCTDKAAITHIWSLFSAAPPQQRILILQGLLSTCCMPQLSFLHDAVKPLLRIDFIAVLPSEVSLKILSFLDAKSLCHAAQVSRTWKSLADDDAVWHRMCEQHIDKKCTKCGWGLPSLVKKRTTRTNMRKRALITSSSPQPVQMASYANAPLRNTCGSDETWESQTTILASTSADLPSSASEASSSEREVKRQRVESPQISDSQESSTPPPVTHDVATLPAQVHRPWKDVYSERLIIERNWRRNKYNMRILSGHTDGVMCLQFCDTSNILITGSYDKTVRIWNLETGEVIRVLTGHTRCVRALQFDDAKLVTGSMDHTLKIWSLQTGQCIRTLEGHTDGIVSLHFDSRILASGSVDTTIKVWNFETGECCTLRGHTDWVNSVRIHQHSMIVSGSDDTTIRLWDLNTRTCIRVIQGHVGQVQVGIPSGPGFTHRFIEAPVARPDMVQHQQLHYLRQQQHLQQQQRRRQLVEFSPICTVDNANEPADPPSDEDKSEARSDQPIIISGSLDNTIKIWSMVNGQCLRTLFGHVEGVWALAYDKLRIVSGSHDNSVKLWDMESGRCIHTLEGHRGPVTAVALSDMKVISASDDGDIRIWDYGVHATV
ncbi:quinon protein alcohol dehydrogenase-like superfamily [Umbelopsis sp. AD052]|nr:quinon protein alcohol dehydrogenase-like superfamily [Umbelopsis sp. AD052]